VGDLGPTITVGFDGSAGAEAALRLALAEARLRDAELRVVHAWLPTPSTAGTSGLGQVPPRLEVAVRREAALAPLRVHVEHARLRAGAEQVDVDVVGVQGVPRHVLVEESRSADLLVVGTRGHGRLPSVVPGSVSHACARDAGCPVVIVPPQPADESAALTAAFASRSGRADQAAADRPGRTACTTVTGTPAPCSRVREMSPGRPSRSGSLAPMTTSPTRRRRASCSIVSASGPSAQ
jgi:nucleotide-binding universal stress UspA family protein